MMRIIRSSELREGRWKNGMGVSWDIAAEPPDAGMENFSWRFAIARIDGDVPFSVYPGVDRVFTLIDGEGLSLDIEGHGLLVAGSCHVPHRFPGDARAACRLFGGPCRALNLFLRRGACQADVAVFAGTASLTHRGPVLVFALEGLVGVNGERLETGDAAVATGEVRIDSGSTRCYRALLQMT